MSDNSYLNKVTKLPKEVIYKKTALGYFAIFTGKHRCWSLFFITLQTFTPGTLLTGNSNTGVFLLRSFCDNHFLKNIC